MVGLDFLDTIKLVNYVRSEVKAGNKTPDVSSKAKFADDAFMKPVLEDDALLYSLDDIAEDQDAETTPGNEAERRVIELQEDLERLQTQFSEYRLAVQKSLADQLNKEDEKLEPGASVKRSPADKIGEADEDYFTSYSYNSMSSCFSSTFLVPLLIWFFKSNSRIYAEGHHPHRCLSRLRLREQARLQRQGCPGCWLWNWYSVHVLRQGWSEEGHLGRQLEHHRPGQGNCVRQWPRRRHHVRKFL